MRKRKHTALDDASFGEDEAPLSDSRLLRALPRRGRSRNIAASAATDDELAASSPRPPHVSSAATDTQPDPVPEETDTTAALDGLVSVPTRTSKRRRLDAQTSSTAGSSRNTGTSVGHSAGENDGNGLAPPPPPARSCGNCGSTTTSGGAWYNSKLLLVKICRACYQYEKTHSRCRTFDMAERARLKAHIRPALQSGQRCGNCGTESNVCYISKLLFVKICSGCYQYERSHSECRPKCRERPQRPQYLTECGNCHSKTTHGGGWHNSVANPDSQLRRCQACYEYESKKGKPRPESLYQKPPRGPMVKCNNCGEKNTREWRTDSEGKTVCDECGIYYLANGFARPLSKDDIRRRRARLNRERLRYAPIGEPETSTEKTSEAPKACINCKSTTTAGRWIGSRLVPGTVCNACYMYEKRHNRQRPLSLIQHRPLSGIPRAPLLPGSNGCSNCATQSTSRLWSRSVLTSGWVLCTTCSRYERKQKCHRPKRLWKDV